MESPANSVLSTRYLQCIEKGRDLHNRLQTFERTDRTDFSRLETLYELDSGNLAAPKDLRSALQELNVDPQRFTFIAVRPAGTTPFDDAIYSNRFNAKHGAIVNMENYKNNDTNPPAQRLWPSEVVWQSFLHVAAYDKIRPPALRVIVRDTVVNDLTKSAIWQAQRFSTSAPLHKSNRMAKGYTRTLTMVFMPSLGSPNGASTMRMLLDHKAQIGYRVVDRVIVQECKTMDDIEDYRKSRTFIILLSDPRKKDFHSLPTKIRRPIRASGGCKPRRYVKLCRSQHNRDLSLMVPGGGD